MSVVIPTHNRKEKLKRCLAAVTTQMYPVYEVIVVDDGSSDGTSAMVARDFPEVHIVRQATSQGPAAARNQGIRQASGDVIAFTDDDCVPPPDWLKRHANHYTNHQIGAVGGHQVSGNPNFYDKFDMAHYADEYRHLRLIEKLALPGGLYSNNLSVPKAVLAEVGLFDERFLTGADPELTRRISRAGYILVHDPDIRVEHLKVHTFRSYCRMRFRRGCGVILTDLKEDTLSLKRFVPLPNPIRTWQDWSNYRMMFSGGALDFVALLGLAFISRLVDVAGRAYYLLVVGRDYRKRPATNG